MRATNPLFLAAALVPLCLNIPSAKAQTPLADESYVEGDFDVGTVTDKGTLDVIAPTGNSAATSLKVTGDGGVLFQGSGSVGTGTVPATGAGTRFMWVPKYAAIRAGIVSGTAWNVPGYYSAAFGYDSVASGSYSLAAGLQTEASGSYSVALGSFSDATASHAIALGEFAYASGAHAVAIGNSNDAAGDYSVAMGSGSAAQGYNQFVIGQFNIAQGSGTTWNSTDNLFIIGNGTDQATLANAFVVRKDGRTSLFNKAVSTSVPSIILDPVTPQITVGTSTVVTANSSGNVGIGTGFAQDYGLNVAKNSSGSMSFVDVSGNNTSGDGGSGIILSDNNAGKWSIFQRNQTTLGPANALHFATGEGGTVANAKMSILQDGNIGIGTSNPKAKLHVGGTPSSSALYDTSDAIFAHAGASTTVRLLGASSTAADGAVFAGLRSRGSISSPSVVQSGDAVLKIIAHAYDGASKRGVAQIAMEVDGTPGSSDMPGRITFATTPDGSSTLAEKMRITNAGNVGIGTNNPGTRLHVSKSSDNSMIIGDAGNTAVRITNTHSPNTGSKAELQFALGGVSNPSSVITAYSESSSGYSAGSSLLFSTSTSGDPVERVRITSQGNVGIGTDAPLATLEVDGTAKFTGAVTVAKSGDISMGEFDE